MPNLKVLENSGTPITSSDGVALNQVFSLDKDGIVKGRLNDFEITKESSTRIKVASGHLIYKGINLILEEDIYFDITPTEQSTTYYLICNIQAGEEQIEASLLLVSSYEEGSLAFNGETLEGNTNFVIAYIYVNNSGISSMSLMYKSLSMPRHIYKYTIRFKIQAESKQLTFRFNDTFEYTESLLRSQFLYQTLDKGGNCFLETQSGENNQQGLIDRKNNKVYIIDNGSLVDVSNYLQGEFSYSKLILF